ncbi:MAG: hypothetical protein ACK5E3_16735, partial [Planctomycetota bacterium]
MIQRHANRIRAWTSFGRSGCIFARSACNRPEWVLSRNGLYPRVASPPYPMNIFDKTEPVCMTLATRVAKHPMHATGDPQLVGNACIVSLGRIDLHSSNPTRSIGVELSSS